MERREMARSRNMHFLPPRERIFTASENLDLLRSRGEPIGQARKKLISLQRMLINHP